PFAGGLAPVLDGAAHATRDRAAVIVISDGAADSRLIEPVVKATVVADPASAGHWIAHAAQLCMADPRGAVHLVVPAGVAEAPALPVVTACRRAPVPAPAADALDALADSIARAARPVLVAGLETGPDDAKWLRALAESVPAPVLTTPKGKGALPDPHPLVLGLLAAEHPLLAQSDLLIVVGVDPVEVSPGVWPAGVPLARVGRAPGNGVVGEIALVIEELAPRLRGRARADWDVAALDRLKRGLGAAAPGPGLARRRVVEIARELTTAGTRLALDVPLAAAWQSVAPRECLVPNGVATLGFGLPAALAVAADHPLLVTPAWVAERLGRADVRIIDLSDAEDYARGHIPGAVHLDFTDTRPQASEGVFRAPTAEEGRRLFARLGITPDTTVILYDDGGGLHAAWLFLVLDVLGHPRVSVLDGGSQRWRAAGGATADVRRARDHTGQDRRHLLPDASPRGAHLLRAAPARLSARRRLRRLVGRVGQPPRPADRAVSGGSAGPHRS